MKAIKLSVVTMAILGATAAMAAEPVQQYNADQGVIRNTTGVVVDSTRSLVDTAIHPAAVTAEIGTLGYGANVAWGVNESTELQAGWNGLNAKGDVKLDTTDSIINWKKVLGDDYKDFKGNFAYDVKSSNPYLGVQVRPFQNWLTVGTGVMVPRNKFDVTLTANEVAPMAISGWEYKIKPDSSLQIKSENKNALAPYATIGFRPNIDNRWGLVAQVGAAYMGGNTTDVKVDGDIEFEKAPKGVPQEAIDNATNNTKEDFKKRVENEFNSDKLKWFPIAKLGLTYRF